MRRRRISRGRRRLVKSGRRRLVKTLKRAIRFGRRARRVKRAVLSRGGMLY